MVEIARLDAADAGFEEALGRLLARAPEQDAKIEARVAEILREVRARGDAALLEFTERFDGVKAARVSDLEITPERRREAWERLPEPLRDALTEAASRIRRYAEHQRLAEFRITDEHGNVMGQRVTAIARAGIYVPGGKAAYPSSVLMNAIPAKVAGVGEIVMVVPAPRGELNPAVLAAAHLADVDRVFTIGGAQAIAALAYGTETIPAVDKIVGPGNVFVAAAKRQVFGQVGIDAIAGPSEIVIVGDGRTDPRWIAMDLFAQAEHDEDARAILISPDAGFLDAVHEAMRARIEDLPRAGIIRKSLKARGALIRVRDLAQAAGLVNRIAPEHLELSVEEPEALLREICHAGAVFLGRYAPEAFGDYCAGPNHVLPTARAARYASPLGVHEFQKRTSLIACTPAGARALAGIAASLAEAEGLQAHAQSAQDRMND